MSVSCKDFYQSSLKLLEGKSEIDLRNAASRAYYAAFHACKILADDLRLPSYAGGKFGSHEQLIERFRCSRELQHKSIGYILQEGREARKWADYELAASFTLEEAKSAVKSTQKIFGKIDGLVGNQNKK